MICVIILSLCYFNNYNKSHQTLFELFNMHLSSITLCFVLVCNFISKVVVSETCLDVGHVNFTIRCNFEDCRIPGQFCDYSDEDFPRCANCDQDKCNEAIIPGECTIPCMSKLPSTFLMMTSMHVLKDDYFHFETS